MNGCKKRHVSYIINLNLYRTVYSFVFTHAHYNLQFASAAQNHRTIIESIAFSCTHSEKSHQRLPSDPPRDLLDCQDTKGCCNFNAIARELLGGAGFTIITTIIISQQPALRKSRFHPAVHLSGECSAP